jgi:hypothetical protein
MFYELSMKDATDEELLDRIRVKEIVEYDRYCCDYGHKAEERKLWHDDGIFYSTWFKGPIDEYLSTPPLAKKPDEDILKESHSHRVNNTVVWLKGNRAVAELLCFLNFRTKLGDEWVDTQCWCRMHYRAEKREGKWGLVYFEGIYEKDRMDTVFGDSGFSVPREVLEKYRPINWNMAYRRDVFNGGLKNAEEWVGSDKPETLARLYEESSKWLGLGEE